MRLELKIVALFVCGPVLSALAADRDWVAASDAVTERVLKAQGAFEPENMSSLGLTEFDDDILDLRANLYQRVQAETRRLVAMVEEARRTAEHPKVIQDMDILLRSLQDELESGSLYREHMLPYFDVPGIVFGSFRGLLDPRNDPARYPAALQRLAAYTGRTGGEPLVDLARARTTERFDQAGLTGPYRRELERDLENLPRMDAGMRELFADSGLEGWQEGLDILAAQLAAYGEWVRQELLPRARTDNRLPPAIYADNLKNFGVRMAPEDLIRMAQFSFQEIKSEMRSVARLVAEERGWEDSGLMQVMAALKKNQIPPEEVLPVYRARLAEIEALIREHDVVTLPDRAASIRLATEAEAASIPAPFMSPPQLIGNTGQYGEFVLVSSNPSLEGEQARMDDWTHDAVTWAMTVHEARPGHEMQFAALIENGTSLARATFAFNSANVEGWGLYAEAIMKPYLPLEGQLFALLARLQRAGRMFMDPMVNLGLMSPDQAVSFMTDQVGLSPAMAHSEADRYAFLAPGQATSYFYGYTHLQRLRTEVEIALGERFRQRAYHDFVLAQGLLPPELLREAVLEEFIPSQQ